ncbi:MAG: type I restriction endonuclease subunit R [Paludibacteraceae bacterium]|nr:type I restriction endonuclease subunit R [Paludibacteraceae bacterium]
MSPISFKEDHISQIPALAMLMKMGYTYLTPDEVMSLRGNSTGNVLLEQVLRRQLRELNTIQVNTQRTALFTDQNIENGIQALRNVTMVDGYVAANQTIYDLLTYGKTLEQSIDGDKKSYNLQYINWQDPSKNVYHVTEEFAVTRAGRRDTYRPDIVLFVNGIPLVVIECKCPHIQDSLSEAISQHLRNQKEDGIRSLFRYSELLLAINRDGARYGTAATPFEFWSTWKEQFIDSAAAEKYEAEVNQIVNTPLDEESDRRLFASRYKYVAAAFHAQYQKPIQPTEQDKALYSLCRPERLLKLMFRYTVYDGGVKKVARYQQFFAVEQTLARVRNMEQGHRRGGVIWHTQGSGKSLTMVMLAQAIALDETIRNPKIILVTDRTELDKQIGDTFKKCGKTVRQATTGANLSELLQSDSDAVVTTIINKFETAVKRIRKPLTDPNIFVLIDEAHRSQYGEMAINMQRTLPNACCIAMTGTPLMKREKSTAARFGGIIRPVYTVGQAVEDGAVVPLLYEGRITEQTVRENAIDRYFEMVSASLNEQQRIDLKKKFSRAEPLSEAEQRLYANAWDISMHYRDNWQGTGFKGQLVCSKKRIAIKYKQFLDEIGIVSSEVLITSPDTREGEDEAFGGSSDLCNAFWKKTMDRFGNAAKYEKEVINSFRHSEQPEIIIVVDKLLTGFDEPQNTVMYLDRQLKEHTLLQAVARVNRVCEGKDFGYIIDYSGILRNLYEALDTYSNDGEDDIEKNEIEHILTQINEQTDRLPQTYSNLWDLFKQVDNKRDLEQYARLLAQEDIRQKFYDLLTEYAKALKMALSTMDFYRNTPAKQIEQYKEDLTFFVNLRNAVKQRYSDTVDYRQYESQIQKLIDTHVESSEVKSITPLVNIFDHEQFEQEVEKIIGTAAKADTIASRTAKYINENMDTDPAFFKRFSELLRQTIEDYRRNRIDEAEYLQRVKKLKDDVLAHTDSDIPAALDRSNAAKAFYGQCMETMCAKDTAHSESEMRQIVADAALAMDDIIKQQAEIVDWQTNYDIIGQIKIQMEDYLTDYVQQIHGIPLSFDEMDALIDSCVNIAMLWYKK